MKKILIFVAWVACAGLVIAWSAKPGLAADKVSYSGKYSAERLKTTSGGETDSTLEVVQNEDSVEVTRVELGKRTTSRCPFNDSRVSTQVRVAFRANAKRNLRRNISFLNLSWWPGHSPQLLLCVCTPKNDGSSRQTPKP